MCDTIAGELLVSFHKDDTAALMLIDDILNGKISHVQVVESLGEKLSKLGFQVQPKLDFLFYRLRVPSGEEEWKINYLQFFYKHKVFDALSQNQMPTEVLSRSNLHLQVVPHSILHISSKESIFGSIELTETHEVYKRIIGSMPSKEIAQRRNILLIDTGISSTDICRIINQKNFVVNSQFEHALDDNGHGTVVAKIIHDLCPSAGFLIYKVANDAGRASEWDTMAALAAPHDANLINISLSFGLTDTHCPTCGRESRSSRSAVFENLLIQLAKASRQLIIVAAAGNGKRNELSFPARFGSVLAIESIDREYNLSVFTNRSTVNAEGAIHMNVFVLPGGQKDSKDEVMEYVAESSKGIKYYGTSFSAAYATGLISALWSESKHFSKDGVQMIDYLRESANKNLPKYDAATFGNGMMCFSCI